MKVRTKQEYRKRRHLRLRQKISGTAQRPRMSVYVSSRHMYVQFIDDTVGRTLAHCSTLTKGIGTGKNNIETARNLGRIAAQAALEKGIRQVVFDRGGFTYGGRIKALADAAREAGLQF